MKITTTLLAMSMVSLIALPIDSAILRKRAKLNNCIFVNDADCLPYYINTATNANFDELSHPSEITSYNGLIFTGFNAIAQPAQPPFALPSSSSNFARAKNSTAVANSTRITSEGVILKFKTFSIGCEQFNNPTPVACSLDITGFNPVGDPPESAGHVTLDYFPTPAIDGTAPMTFVDEDGLDELGVANHFVVQTSSGETEVKPRLVLDDVEAVYYQTL